MGTGGATPSARGRDQAEAPGPSPIRSTAWPDVPTASLLCRDDRLFPAAWARRVVAERLGLTPDEIAGGHCPALGPAAGAGRSGWRGIWLGRRSRSAARRQLVRLDDAVHEPVLDRLLGGEEAVAVHVVVDLLDVWPVCSA